MSSPSGAKSAAHFKELEKYVKHLFFKTAQIIVQSRQGGKTYTQSTPHPKTQSWFSLAINDNSEISHEAKKVANSAQVIGQGILSVPLCIEVSLKTTEGDLLVLETWVLSMKDGSDSSIRHNTVYNHMGLLLKSLLCVSRVLPAYKLARSQGPDTHVMCYRVYPGEPLTKPLGNGQLSANVGQVITACGTLTVRVDYRTQMTINPNAVSGLNLVPAGNVGEFSGSGSSQQSAPIWAKSDHFPSAENLHVEPSNANNVNVIAARAPRTDLFDQNVTTSDESTEAMRIFAASPPDTNFAYAKRTSDHYSSNESIGLFQPQKFRSRSSTNQSHKSEDDSMTSDNVKVGAFATRKASIEAVVPSKMGENEDDDEFLDLFNIDPIEPKMQKLKIASEPAAAKSLPKSPAQRKIDFDSEEPANKAKPGGGDFVVVNLKTPFSFGSSASQASKAMGGVSDKGELGIFFRDVQSAPQLKHSAFTACNESTDSTLEAQLTSLTDQLSGFENNLLEYDDLLKVLDATATSESESEAN